MHIYTHIPRAPRVQSRPLYDCNPVTRLYILRCEMRWSRYCAENSPSLPQALHLGVRIYLYTNLGARGDSPIAFFLIGREPRYGHLIYGLPGALLLPQCLWLRRGGMLSALTLTNARVMRVISAIWWYIRAGGTLGYQGGWIDRERGVWCGKGLFWGEIDGLPPKKTEVLRGVLTVGWDFFVEEKRERGIDGLDSMGKLRLSIFFFNRDYKREKYTTRSSQIT